MSGARGRHYGRTRRRLVELLEAEGFRDVSIAAAQGRERSDVRHDIYRWEGYAMKNTISCTLYSWDTMTLCVRNGIVLQNESSWSFDVSAKRGK